MWWGHSPSQDLRLEVDDIAKDLNVLLIGTSDARHVLHSSAKWYRHKECGNINWFIAEPSLELVARQLLLLSVALAQDLGPREKVRIFMELYGNTLLRASTAVFLSRRAAQLASIVTEQDQLPISLPGVGLGRLRYKDRDCLQELLTYWRSPGPRLSMTRLWDAHLRRSLGTRYDSRLGTFDWDYHMRLCDRGGDRVSSQEYRHWRNTGVAFTWLETEASRPNPTLMSRINGSVGDMTSGPYVTYGMNAPDDPDMTRKANGKFVKRSTDLTERNLLRLFHELQYGMRYEPESCDDEHNLGVVITEVPSTCEMEPDRQQDPAPGTNPDNLLTLTLPRSHVEFLPCSAVLDLFTKPRYLELFNIVMVSHTMTHLLSPSLMATAATDALLLVEGKKFVVNTHKDDVSKFGDKIGEIAKECGCVPTREFDPLKDAVASFRK